MKAVILSRGEGKTARALDWLREDSRRYLLMPKRAMAEVVRRAHADVADRILSADEARNRFLGMQHDAVIGIDELEMTLHVLLKDRYGPLARLDFATIDADTLEWQA